MAFFGLLALLSVHAGYVSRRHAFPPLVALTGYAAIGLVFLGSQLRRLPLLARGGPLAGSFVLAAILVLPHQLEPRRMDKLAERNAAEWVAAEVARRERAGSLESGELRVGGVGGRIAYYAALPLVDLRSMAPEALGAALARNEVAFAVLDREESIAALDRDPRYELTHEVEAAGRRAAVFERVPAPEAEPES